MVEFRTVSEPGVGSVSRRSRKSSYDPWRAATEYKVCRERAVADRDRAAMVEDRATESGSPAAVEGTPMATEGPTCSGSIGACSAAPAKDTATTIVIVAGGADTHNVLKQMLHEYVSFALFSIGAALGSVAGYARKQGGR